jgi:hypothetical protein
VDGERHLRPRARAANAKDFLAFLESEHPGSLGLLRQREPPEVIGAIEGAARTDWIDIDINGVHVTEIVQLLGPERARHAWRKYTSTSLIRSPAIKALVDGAVRLFGLSIRSLVRMSPFFFQQSFRDCGDLEITWGEREAKLSLVDIPAELARFPAYAVLFEGVFQGFYDIVQMTPQLDYRPDLAARRIEARFRW